MILDYLHYSLSLDRQDKGLTPHLGASPLSDNIDCNSGCFFTTRAYKYISTEYCLQVLVRCLDRHDVVVLNKHI